MTDDIFDIIEENEKEIEKLPHKVAPVNAQPKKDPTVEPFVLVPFNKDPWFEAKKDYLMDSEAKITEIAKKYKIQKDMLIKRAREENWDAQRKNVFARADAKMKEVAENTLAEVKDRHAMIGRMLQKIGTTSLKKYKAVLGPKDALQYLVEGVRMEGEARGLRKDQPKIVNIITQQQAIIDKYKKKSE